MNDRTLRPGLALGQAALTDMENCMAYMVISYDLVKRKDYPELLGELNRLKAAKALLSYYFLDINNTAAEIRDHLSKYIDDDDRLVVVEFTKKPQFTRMFTTGADWIKARFP
jgi:hypothetical protein